MDSVADPHRSDERYRRPLLIRARLLAWIAGRRTGSVHQREALSGVFDQHYPKVLQTFTRTR